MNSRLENVLPSASRLHSEVPPAPSAPAQPLRVWLVDDDARVRDLLATLLSQFEDIDCSRIFPSAAALLGVLGHKPAPEVVLVDLNLGADDGVSLVGKIKAAFPRTRVFIISTFYDSFHEARARRAGALGFLVKSGVERMVERLRATRPHSRAAVSAEHAPVAVGCM